MDNIKQIEMMINKKKIISTKEIVENNIDNKYIEIAIKRSIIEKFCNSYYIKPELFFDPLYVINGIIDGSVYNLESSLIIHGYNNHIHNKKTVACKKKFNKLKDVECFIDKNLELGKIEHITTEGNIIYVFDLERTICDLIVYKKKVDIDTYSKAIFKYFTSKERNMKKIEMYATELGVLNKVKPIMEVFYGIGA